MEILSPKLWRGLTVGPHGLDACAWGGAFSHPLFWGGDSAPRLKQTKLKKKGGALLLASHIWRAEFLSSGPICSEDLRVPRRSRAFEAQRWPFFRRGLRGTRRRGGAQVDLLPGSPAGRFCVPDLHFGRWWG